jgi:hypothetical protein
MKYALSRDAFGRAAAIWIGVSAVSVAAYWYAARPTRSTVAAAILLGSTLLAPSILTPLWMTHERHQFAHRSSVVVLRACAIAFAALMIACVPSYVVLNYTGRGFFTIYSMRQELANDLQPTLLVMVLMCNAALGGLAISAVDRPNYSAAPLSSSDLSPGYFVVDALAAWLGICGIGCALAVTLSRWKTASGVGTESWLIAAGEFALAGGVTAIPAASSLFRRPATRAEHIARGIGVGCLLPVPAFLVVTSVLFLTGGAGPGVYGGYFLFIYLVIPQSVAGALWGSIVASRRWSHPASDRSLDGGWGSSRAVLLAEAAAMTAVLTASLLATSPDHMGWRGIGCTVYQPMQAEEYWFWDGYKGFAKRFESDGVTSGALAVDPKVCFSVPKSEQAYALSRTRGYVQAVDTWISLLDDDDWDTARGREIRAALERFVPTQPTFSDLDRWWRENRPYVGSTGSGRTLIVDAAAKAKDAPVDRDRREPPASAVEQIVGTPPGFACNTGTAGTPDSDGLSCKVVRGVEFVRVRVFVNKLRDRESTQKALFRLASRNIDRLSGKHSRDVHARLRALTKQDFATNAEWRAWISSKDIQLRFRVHPNSAAYWIKRLDGGRFPDDLKRFQTLRTATGQRFETADAYIRWLSDPDHIAHAPNPQEAQWWLVYLKAIRPRLEKDPDVRRPLEQLTGEQYDDAGDYVRWLQNPDNVLGARRREIEFLVFREVYDRDDDVRRAIDEDNGLRAVTWQRFSTVTEWLEWWQANSTRLVLSDDGSHLIVR